MSPISPADCNLVPRREFIRDQRPASSFSILALSGTALLRLYSFPPEAVVALRKHLDRAHLILGSRELIQNNFLELSLDGKPWSNPKSMRSEKLIIEIIDVLYRSGHNFLSTLDYGREQDDRVIIAFSRPSLPPPPPSSAASHNMSNDSMITQPHPVKVPFAISFISQNHLRVIAPPLHLTPAILQTVRGSWPRGVVSEKTVAENVYEFKLKGYRWFQEDTFATDSLRHVLSLLGSLDGFGFTLLTSLSLTGRSRSKDLWVFTSLSQTTPPGSQPDTPLGSHTDLQEAPSDKARERRRSHPAPAHSLSANNLLAHTRAATESSIAVAARSSVQGLVSHKSAVVRKPAPRAQLPVSVAHSSSNDNARDTVPPNAQVEGLRMELQSSIGSAEDMTGIGTQKYGRGGEPDIGLYQQPPFASFSMAPGVAPPYFSSMSASVMKASQLGESPQGAQSFERTTRRTEVPSHKQETIPSPVPPRSRHSPVKTTPQPGTPIPPLLSPGAFRDSSLSSNTGQTVDLPNTWTGLGRENGHSGSSTRGPDPKENVFPGGWIPGLAGNRESTAPGDHADKSNAHRHQSSSPYRLTPEEQEVKVSLPELVHPKHRLPRSGEATIVAEAPRADIHRVVGVDRVPPPMKSTPDKHGNDQRKGPAEGWVLVNVGQPGTTSTPQASKPSSLQRKKSFPPMAQKTSFAQSPSPIASRATPAGSPVGSGHKKASSIANPSSMSPAAKAIVIIDAVEAKRKATGGESSQSAFRKFFSLSRPDSPSKSPGKERRLPSPPGGSKSKFVEQEDNGKKREGGRERRRVKGMSEVTKSDRRMSVD
ncbi:hypothetical protein BJV78DRAFT_1150379 [Lactifluus subvellereus]|nr:hypothetical protein BJV78DRAFT_1150379 [Lactifluus subvellereus]